MDSTLALKIQNIEKRLQTVWPGWHVIRYIGTGAYSEVYEISREAFGTEMRSALKIIQLDQDGAPVKCTTETWNTVFLPPREEPTASVLQATLGNSSTRHEGSSRDPSYTNTNHSTNNSRKNESPDPQDSSGHLFTAEIDILRQLQGTPNIVSIEDFCFQNFDKGTLLYIRMELLTCLSQILRSDSSDLMSEEEIHKLGMDICLALIYCERIGILHRDIKPGNLFVNRFGDYKIGDFGISRPLESLRGSDNKTVTGTLSYMAPEVYHSSVYGNTVDLYSLGIVLYQLLNRGRIPFLPESEGPYGREDVEKANSRRFGGEPLPPIPFADENLQMIIRKACSFKPEDRYPSARQFYDALSDWKPGQTTSLPAEPVTAETASSGGNTSERCPRKGSVPETTDSDRLPPETGAGQKSSAAAGSTAAVPKKGAEKPTGKSPGKGLLFGILAAACLIGFFLFIRMQPLFMRAPAETAAPVRSLTQVTAGRISSSVGSLTSDELEKIRNTPLEIRDPVLKNSLLKALGPSGGQILLKDTAGVTELSLEITDSDKGKGIQDLHELAFFRSLQSLSLRECGLKDTVDYSVLQKLPDLQILDLHGNEIAALEPFQSLTGLQWLDLSSNKITSVSPLAGLTGLRSLALYHNEITELSALQGMTALTELYLDENKITSLKGLEGAAGLQILRADDNQITDLAPLQKLTGLKTLVLSENKISDLAPLKSMTGMEELWLDDNQISKADPLSGMKSLTYLNLRKNKISDLTPLQKLTGLTDLVLSRNSIEDLSALEKLTGLDYLDLEGNKIQKLSSLQKLTSLESLYLNSNSITDPGPLKKLSKLKTLAMGNNKISDLSSLKDLTSLESLDLYTNEIGDLSPLEGLKKLTWLNVGRNRINSLAPVAKMEKLESLEFYRNSVSDISPVEKLTGLKYLVADVNSISDLKPLKKLKHLETLYLEYNSISDVSPLKDLKSLKEVYLAGNPVSDYSQLDSLAKSAVIYKESQ